MKLELHTTYGTGWQDSFCQTVTFTDSLGTENRVVNLYPKLTDQSLEGFGGAITEAAASVYAQMSPAQKQQLMEAYFSPEGMNYQRIRVPIDSCDFSLGQYQAAVLDEDGNLLDLDFSRLEQTIFPMLRDAEAAAGRKLPLALAPWFPPAAWKTNGDRAHGGKLRRDCYDRWAEYLCRYVEGYRSRGFWVQQLSIQNEPHAVQTWDSCIFTAEEMKRFLCEHLRPTLARHGLTDLELYVWDHNKERLYEWMDVLCTGESEKIITGAAFHWYSGDHFEILDLCRRRFPDKKLLVSESCIEFYKFDPTDAMGAAESLGHEIIGDLNHGACFFGDWNLLLDQQGGPNYVGNYCLAPFLYDTQKKKLEPQLLQLYFSHFAHYLTPGSVRIAHSCFTDRIDVTAWARPDGSIALVLLDRDRELRQLTIRMEGLEAGLILYPNSISSAVIRPNPVHPSGFSPMS